MVGVGQLLQDAHVPVIGGIGTAGNLDAAHFLQRIDDHQPDAGMPFQRGGDLGLQSLPDAAAAGLEQQVGAAALAVDLQQAVLDAVEGVLQTEVQHGLRPGGAAPNLAAPGDLQAKPQAQPAFARLAGTGQHRQPRRQQVGNQPPYRRDGGIPEGFGVYNFGFFKIRHGNNPFVCGGVGKFARKGRKAAHTRRLWPGGGYGPPAGRRANRRFLRGGFQ